MRAYWFNKTKTRPKKSVKRKPTKQRGSRFIWALLLLGLFVVAILATVAMHRSSVLPIKHVRVRGDFQHTNRQGIKQILIPLVATNFFGVHVRRIKSKILTMPWVAAVEVKRIWPDKIVIRITEQKPVVRWGKKSLLNAQGDIFSPPVETFPLGLPRLQGVDRQAQSMLEQYQVMAAMIRPLQLKIVKLQLSPRGTWRVWLNNEMQLVLGRKESQAKLMRFVQVYPRIVVNNKQSGAYIDLRYTNGLAIKWLAKN